jgi:hypothetical protein
MKTTEKGLKFSYAYVNFLFTKLHKKVPVQRHVIVIINYLPQFLLFYQTTIFSIEYFSRI